MDAERVRNAVFLGELGLDGVVRPVRGVLPVARRLSQAGDRATLVLPTANLGEAALVRDVRLCAPTCIAELLTWLESDTLPATVRPNGTAITHAVADFSDVVGQESAKRALEIAAAGGHNVLLMGPPGAGKTMLARRLPSILPALTDDETLEVTAIHSVAGLLNGTASLAQGRPFRAPHHSVSTAGLIGGGSSPRPGEVSLAHHGVLFLDELLEFPRHTLEALRQPLEDGRVTIARALRAVSYPARFTLVAAMNPCPCGFAGDPSRPCACSVGEIHRYRSRLSGPLLDRIDLHLTLTPVPRRLLGESNGVERSECVRTRVEEARERQRQRFAAAGSRATHNAESSGRLLLSALARDARELLDRAAESLALSARAYHRVIKVARTIADLGNAEQISVQHVAESLRYRPR